MTSLISSGDGPVAQRPAVEDEVGRLDCAARPVPPEQLAEVSSLLVSLGSLSTPGG